jgi:hypothetical protein
VDPHDIRSVELITRPRTQQTTHRVFVEGTDVDATNPRVTERLRDLDPSGGGIGSESKRRHDVDGLVPQPAKQEGEGT